MTPEAPDVPRLAPRCRLLLGPGPSMVHPSVYEALGLPLMGHLDPEFLKIMDEIQTMLRRVFATGNRLTLAVSGTGSAGMEATLVNLVEPGDGVLVCVNGVFGARMCDIVERCGGRLRRIDRPWGEVFDPGEISDALAADPGIGLVAIVHAETSTGAWQPLDEIGRLCRESDRLFLVDAVTSLGGVELSVDDWLIDACYSGTQKCLSCPPGLAPVTFGERAVERIGRRRSKVRSWYLDVSMLQDYWAEGSRTYHHTAPISMNYALHRALSLVLDEGLEARFARHRRHSRALGAGLEALGCRPFAQAGHRLPMLNSVYLPDGIDDAAIRRRLLDGYDIEIGGGLGELAGRLWRVGLMGESCRRENVLRLLEALERIVPGVDGSSGPGGAVDAAAAAYGAPAAPAKVS